MADINMVDFHLLCCSAGAHFHFSLFTCIPLHSCQIMYQVKSLWICIRPMLQTQLRVRANFAPE